MHFALAFPTHIHQQAADTIVDFWRAVPQTAAILVTNSCARGVATPESDLDFSVMLEDACSEVEQSELEQQWRSFYHQHAIFQQLKQCGPFVGVHLDCFKPDWQPEIWDDGGGPDDFETAVGNLLVYSAALWQKDHAFDQAKARWLPYYAEDLRQQRLAMVHHACSYDLDFVAFYLQRELYFQAFDRLYKAFKEFLQALFIARRTYPIAYNKWIHQQIVEILHLPDLYAQLPAILQIQRLESAEMLANANQLRSLLQAYTKTGNATPSVIPSSVNGQE